MRSRVEVNEVDLRLCPSCDGYVRPEWSACANCGRSLIEHNDTEPLAQVGAPSAPPSSSARFASSSGSEGPVGAAPDTEPSPLEIVKGAHFRTGTALLDHPTQWRRNGESESSEESESSDGSDPYGGSEPNDRSDPYGGSEPNEESEWNEDEPESTDENRDDPAPSLPEPTPISHSESSPTDLMSAAQAPTQSFVDQFTPQNQSIPLNSAVQWTTKRILAVVVAVVITVLVSIVGITLMAVLAVSSALPSADDRKVTVPAAPNARAWVTYSDPESRFKVSLPATPAEVKTDGGTSSISAVSAEGTEVQVSWSDVKDTPIGGEDALFDQVVSNGQKSGLTVDSALTSTQSGRRQLNARFSDSAVSRYGDTLAVRIDDRLYVITVWSANKAGDPQTFGRVTSSLKPVYR